MSKDRRWSHLSYRPSAVAFLATAALAVAAPRNVHAFCGFYVAKADVSLYNQASQVALVRDGDRTVLTMSKENECPA